jgi:hypothetical protein
MAHMQGANAVVAQHEKSLERDQVSIMLFRQLKLSNVGSLPPYLLATICSLYI